MRTFLRHVATGHYFRSPEKWTLDREDAHDFGFISKALKTAHKLQIRDLELEFSLDNPEQVITTPFARFLRGLARNRNHACAARRTPRSVATA
jgi:hypothetical protein